MPGPLGTQLWFLCPHSRLGSSPATEAPGASPNLLHTGLLPWSRGGPGGDGDPGKPSVRLAFQAFGGRLGGHRWQGTQASEQQAQVHTSSALPGVTRGTKGEGLTGVAPAKATWHQGPV